MNEEQCREHGRRIETLASVLGIDVELEHNRFKGNQWALVVAYMPLGGPEHTILDTRTAGTADAFGDALEMVQRSKGRKPRI